MPHDFLFSRWARLLGAATCAMMALTVCDIAVEAGVLDFSNDVHWRARVAAVFWAMVMGALLAPPAGIEAGMSAMLIGGALGFLVGLAELTVSYVLSGFSVPSFYWSKLALFVFMPAVFGVMVPAFARSPSTPLKRRSILERLVSHPILALFFGACTVLGTAATIWPELGIRIHGWF